MTDKKTYENLFGPDKKKQTEQIQNQNQQQYGQYPNMENPNQPYGQNQYNIRTNHMGKIKISNNNMDNIRTSHMDKT